MSASTGLIDCDVHNELPSWSELRPYLPQSFHPWIDDDGPGFALRYYETQGSGFMDDVVHEPDGLRAADPEWVREQLIDRYRVTVAVLTGSLIDLTVHYDERVFGAIASAYNEWTIERWLRDRRYFKGSILLPPNPTDAAAEIRRLAGYPGMVQTIMPSAARAPYGSRYYWPIYDAASECGLPVAIHPGAEGLAAASAPTPAGYPSTYLEFHTGLPLTAMAHCTSLVTEGVFEAFPALKFVFVELGVCWVPHIMGRLDALYPDLRLETPHLKTLPSELIRRHCYFSTQPMEEPTEKRHLTTLLTLMDADDRLLFATDYPHWDFDNPATALSGFPPSLRTRVMTTNAGELYGARLYERNP